MNVDAIQWTRVASHRIASLRVISFHFNSEFRIGMKHYITMI